MRINSPTLHPMLALCKYTGGPDVEYDGVTILAVEKTMYENVSKIVLNAE